MWRMQDAVKVGGSLHKHVHSGLLGLGVDPKLRMFNTELFAVKSLCKVAFQTRPHQSSPRFREGERLGDIMSIVLNLIMPFSISIRACNMLADKISLTFRMC